ncbi:hypothetical protein E2C01_056777 [Portunus trituberculatus]|uniref:Uncharacterized protein n=1 Tax=Portunus trituberculatus TaxID=210409 RepID=A0A5B7H0I3_PORTR|nr:hypothetical protein [Portunus trituberculatus]
MFTISFVFLLPSLTILVN